MWNSSSNLLSYLFFFWTNIHDLCACIHSSMFCLQLFSLDLIVCHLCVFLFLCVNIFNLQTSMICVCNRIKNSKRWRRQNGGLNVCSNDWVMKWNWLCFDNLKLCICLVLYCVCHESFLQNYLLFKKKIGNVTRAG
jgi:hypothetical protein